MNSTENEIIKIALKMISEKGYDWLSFQKIANEIGIAKSSVYHYFKTKEDLGIAIIEFIEERIKKKRELILTFESEKEKLNAYLGKNNKEDILYFESLAKFTFNFSGLPLKLQSKIRNHSIKTHAFVLEILKRGTKNKEFNITENLEETARAIVLMSIGSYIYGRVFDNSDLDICKCITDRISNQYN